MLSDILIEAKALPLLRQRFGCVLTEASSPWALSQRYEKSVARPLPTYLLGPLALLSIRGP